MITFHVRPAADEDRRWIRRLLIERWHGPQIVTRGRIHAADTLLAFVAVAPQGNVGLLSYRIADSQCEVVSLDSLMEGQGVGGALLETVQRAAAAAGCRRLWLITTNDNCQALRFYQRRGFVLAALHRNAVARSRELKPSIPQTGTDGIPLRDEIELEMAL